MNIRIGTFNLNNLFERPKIMELKGFSAEGSEVLNDVSKLNTLLEMPVYDADTKMAIEKILNKYVAENPFTTKNIAFMLLIVLVPLVLFFLLN